MAYITVGKENSSNIDLYYEDHGSGKANIGFVFQSYHLIDDLTVFENLELPLSYKHIPRKERMSLVCDTLDRFQIVAKKDLYPNQLSGG